jgi:hypothetical protein
MIIFGVLPCVVMANPAYVVTPPGMDSATPVMQESRPVEWELIHEQ